MLLNKYLVKISNAVQHKNKENLRNTNNSTQNKGYNGTITTNSIDIPINNNNNNNNNNKTTRNLEYERAIAASYASSNTTHHQTAATPKKKKPKINVLNTNDTKTCLTTDELAIIIKGGSNNNKTKRHTLKETGSNQNSYASTSYSPPLRETKSSLTLNLSTSPSSSGVYSSYASTPTSLQAATSSSSRSSSSTESLNSSENGNTPYSSNVSTPTSLPHGGNPAWPLSGTTTLQISFELAVLRIRMWFYPLVLHFLFFINFILI